MVGQEDAGYEAPVVRVLGSVYELTQNHIRRNSDGQWCIFNKTWGDPDYWSMIPIANCSP
jgi:hypothetical protein